MRHKFIRNSGNRFFWLGCAINDWLIADYIDRQKLRRLKILCAQTILTRAPFFRLGVALQDAMNKKLRA